jgi:hypothetical protein
VIFLHKPTKKTILLHLVPLLMFLIIGGIVAMQAGQDQNWDLQNYHYYDAYALLHHREHTDFAVAGLQNYADPLLDTVSYELITHFKPIVASTLLGAIQGINVWLVYELSIIIMSRFIKGHRLYGLSFAIGVVSFFGAGNLGEVGETMADNIVSIVVLTSLLLILRGIAQRKRYSARKALTIKLIAYTLMGVAVGLKLTNTTYMIALLVLEVCNYRSFWKFVKNCLLNVGATLVGLLLSFGAWGYYLFKNFKNPVFPYYNHFFGSPYASHINFIDTRWFPRGIFHWIFYPFYFLIHPLLVAEVKFYDPRIALLYVAVVLFAAYFILARYSKKFPALKVPKEVFMLILFVVVSYLLWEKQFSIYRYLITLEFLSVLAIIAIIWTLIPKPHIATILSVMLLVVLLLVTRPMDWGRIPWQPTFFGIQLPQSGFIAKNATVLLADDQPLSYLLPSFPARIPFIRIGSALLYTSADQQLIHSRITAQEKRGSTFYGIETAASSAIETSYFKHFGFYNGTCKPIHTYISTYFDANPNYYQLCTLRTGKP